MEVKCHQLLYLNKTSLRLRLQLATLNQMPSAKQNPGSGVLNLVRTQNEIPSRQEKSSHHPSLFTEMIEHQVLEAAYSTLLQVE